MNYLDIDDTIIAQCTSEGKSSVDIVRISGKNLNSIYKKITLAKDNPRPNQILKKKIYVNKKLLDVALISYFQTPSSFTGEDVIEINCHGGDFIASNIIKLTWQRNSYTVLVADMFYNV
jgi:tRNA modification GTPase